jgi:Flp pilus assembly secretin CpaC
MGAAWLFAGSLAAAQLPAQEGPVTPLDLPIGRSFPIRADTAVTRVSIVNPTVADVVVVSEREVVINSLASGETDAIIWLANGTRTHYRISVHAPADRKQISIAVHFAEVRKDALREIGVSGLWRDNRVRTGTGIFRCGVGRGIAPGQGEGAPTGGRIPAPMGVRSSARSLSHNHDEQRARTSRPGH